MLYNRQMADIESGLFKPVQDPPPPPPKSGKGRIGDLALRNAILAMKVGDCADAPRTVDQVGNSLYGLRRRYPDLVIQLICRTTKAGHCRIWRVK